VLPSIVSLCLIWFLVESPLWLLIKDRKPEAVETLILLRGADYDYNQEIKEMEDALNVEQTSLLEMLKFGARPVFIIFFLMFFQTSSGSDTISIYSLVIFSDFEISQHTFSLLFQVKRSVKVKF
jgi:SP family facilitated glucose transporter-like MFS transporter 8